MWTPKNFGNKFLGLQTLRRGIELSRNLMTIRLAYEVGMKKVVPYPERFGVYDKLTPWLSNAIGAADTTLMRLTTGYAEFVNGGKKITPTLIDRIQDRYGHTVYKNDQRECRGTPLLRCRLRDRHEFAFARHVGAHDMRELVERAAVLGVQH